MEIHHGDRDVTVGALLREWRALRRMSQLEVAETAGISQRQVSFIESGRSVARRETLAAIAAALDIPLRERNDILARGGFAPLYSQAAFTEPQMRSIIAAANRMLVQQEPFPAVLIDRYWNISSMNNATERFFSYFIDLEARERRLQVQHRRSNFLHFLFDPEGMRPFINDWARVWPELLARVRRETLGHVMDSGTRELMDELFAYGTTRNERRAVYEPLDLPIIPLSFVLNGELLHYFSFVATVGMPNSVSAQELRVDCIFPADERTEERHVALMKS